MNTANGRPPRPSNNPRVALLETARERVIAWITAYSADYPDLRRQSPENLLGIVRQQSDGWARRAVALSLLTRAPTPAVALPGALQAIVRDEGDSAYLRLDAALALVLLGQKDSAALAILRRVIVPKSYFAITQSNMELGAACLGLGLLGDEASRSRISEISRIGINGIGHDADVALGLLKLAS